MVSHPRTTYRRRNIDWGVVEFEPDDVTLHTIAGHTEVGEIPSNDSLNLDVLIPVHAYEYLDHKKEKVAVHAQDNHKDGEFKVQGSYAKAAGGWQTNVSFEHDTTFSWRIEIMNNNVANIWLRNDGWIHLAKIPDTSETEIREIDCMTEIQSNGDFNVSMDRHQVRTRLTSCFTEEEGWTPPRDVLRWSGIEAPTASHDGEKAQIDWLIDQESGDFVFEHYI